VLVKKAEYEEEKKIREEEKKKREEEKKREEKKVPEVPKEITEEDYNKEMAAKIDEISYLVTQVDI